MIMDLGPWAGHISMIMMRFPLADGTRAGNNLAYVK